MRTLTFAAATLAMLPLSVSAKSDKPNIVLLLADDISARELPIYGSDIWTDPVGGSTRQEVYKAETPVLDRLAQEGVWVKTCWSATVSSPARAQIMTGRYAHLQKWWHNGDFGTYINEKGVETTWPVYESSPMTIGAVAKEGGYRTYWSGKTGMPGVENCENYGFDGGCFTDGGQGYPYSDFTLLKVPGEKYFINKDSGGKDARWIQSSWYWKPIVQVVNDPNSEKKIDWWPNTMEELGNYGVNTFGPDVELDHIFDFIDQESDADRPFFIYHTTHLGHDAVDFIDPNTISFWPRTPRIKWEDGKYVRTEPNITGDAGVYDFHDTLSKAGLHTHVNYIDYQVWLYMEKFKEMGIEDNTIFIFTADNATVRYGKGLVDSQKGVHVPLIIYAPGMGLTKQGEQDILVNFSDIMPTIAEIVGVEIPEDYEINGKSLVPYLTTDETEHRDWIYSYRSECQLIRGEYVLRDGYGVWHDVSGDPSDLISYPVITDWSKVSAKHRSEKKKLEAILPGFDKHQTEHNGPGGTKHVAVGLDDKGLTHAKATYEMMGR